MKRSGGHIQRSEEPSEATAETRLSQPVAVSGVAVSRVSGTGWKHGMRVGLAWLAGLTLGGLSTGTPGTLLANEEAPPAEHGADHGADAAGEKPAAAKEAEPGAAAHAGAEAGEAAHPPADASKTGEHAAQEAGAAPQAEGHSETAAASGEHGASEAGKEHAAAAEHSDAAGEGAHGDAANVPPGATEKLLGTASSPDSAVSAGQSLELYADWNARLAQAMDPSLSLLDGGMSSMAVPWFKSLWFGLALGAALGAGTAYFVIRRLLPPAQEEVVNDGWTGAQGSGIELVTAQTLNEEGSVLVVDVLGEQLVLGVSGNRDYVTLLTRLNSPEDVERLEPARLEAMMAARMRAPAPGPAVASSSFASAPRPASTTSTSNLMPPPMEEEHSPDADLEELLDELLGKVRGLKPLTKHTDET